MQVLRPTFPLFVDFSFLTIIKGWIYLPAKQQQMKVLILMGSETDKPVMQEAQNYLQYFNITSDMVVASAHRNPEKVRELVTTAPQNGYGLIIAAAGMAAHLPGVVAAFTSLPVLGVPLEGGLP